MLGVMALMSTSPLASLTGMSWTWSSFFVRGMILPIGWWWLMMKKSQNLYYVLKFSNQIVIAHAWQWVNQLVNILWGPWCFNHQIFANPVESDVANKILRIKSYQTQWNIMVSMRLCQSNLIKPHDLQNPWAHRPPEHPSQRCQWW